MDKQIGDLSQKNAASGATSAANKNSFRNKVNLTTKKGRVFKLLIELGEFGLNTFDASNRHYEYDLRSTVCKIERDFGVKISRKEEKVPNAFGGMTRCMRYFIASADLKHALEVLGDHKAAGVGHGATKS